MKLFYRENGEWETLPRQERDQQASNLHRIGMIARFDNILGRETINSFKMLTTEIKSIFCHPTMVDRIASMLNYLLLQLVGPNKRNLKVTKIQVLNIFKKKAKKRFYWNTTNDFFLRRSRTRKSMNSIRRIWFLISARFT